MKSIIFTLAPFSCGQENGKSIKEIINNDEKIEQIEANEKQETDTKEENNNSQVVQLICENENTTVIYDRNDWGNWSTKGNLQNVRHQVLFEESLKTGKCENENIVIEDDKVVFGCWLDQYTNIIYKDPIELDIDHLVPLKEAFESGAYNWTKEKKKEYYNYMKDKNHLIAVESSLNRSKGSKDVFEWLPTKNVDVYIAQWIEIKATWNLSIDSEELKVLKQHSNDPRLPNTCQ